MGARGGLLLLAFAHTWPALVVGVQDGDFSLLWFAAPFVLLTSLAAVVVNRWPSVAVVVAAITLIVALLGVPLYLVGLLHLLQAALALAVCVRLAGRPRSAAVGH